MAKDVRKINGAVRINDTVFVAGMEDELAEVLAPEQNERLTEKGVIEGFGTAKAEPKDDKAKK